MRRILKTAVWMVALSVSFTACNEVQPRSCDSERDCFGGELCRDGSCVPGMGFDDDADISDMSDHLDGSPSGDCRLSGEGTCGARICNVSSGACEDCQRDLQCGTGGLCDRPRGLCVCAPGYHDCSGVCVPDDAPESCGASCAPCPEALGGVPTCTDGACGIECRAPYKTCGAGCDSTAPCVECLQNADCDEAEAPRCDKGFCARCEMNSDCDHLDQGVCSDGECVECTTAQRTACGSNSCNPATNRCTDTVVGTRLWCESCVADSECEPNHRCVPMTYAGSPRPDGYCLEEADGSCGVVTPIVSQRDSLSGVIGEFYCLIREDLTTCEAIKDFKNPCTQNSDCGADDIPDGLCRVVDGTRGCSYPCASHQECANGTNCIGTPPDNSYCTR